MSERPLCTTRREFLTGGLTFLSSATMLPVFLGNTARVSAGFGPLTGGSNDGDRVLVVVHLVGGNDGLNTVVPCENDLYYKYRRRIAIARKDVLPLDQGLGLHPAARGLKELYDDGKLAIVQGVGYPNHSRNHFTSTLVWQIGDADRHFGSGRLVRSLELVARMITADAPTRVYHVSMGGFDTHTNQVERHQPLLAEFGDAMRSFVKRLKADGLLDRVLVVVFSEFGRRVQENAGGGTHHGEAAPMFLIGSKLRPGIHEKHPSLAALHRGALIPGCDLRRVYATVFSDWLKVKPEEVLGPAFAPLRLIAA